MQLIDALTITLRDWGVRYVFGVSGANIEHFHDAIYRLGQRKLQAIMTKKEDGAAFMADGYARVHHRLGVCCCTSGGAMLNMAAGIAESYAERVPVLGIVGQVPLELEGKGGFQDSSGLAHTVDAIKLWQSITKFTGKITEPDSFWEILQQAVTQVLTRPYGPAIILIPRDLNTLQVTSKPATFPSSLEYIKEKALKPIQVNDYSIIIEKLNLAKKPLLVLDSGCKASNHYQAIKQFIIQTMVPVTCVWRAPDSYSNTANNFLGLVGIAGHPSANNYLNEQADLVIFVGSRIDMMVNVPLSDKLLALGQNVIFIHDDIETPRNAYPNATIIDSECGIFFKALLQYDLPRFRPVTGYTHSVIQPQLALPINQNITKQYREKNQLKTKQLLKKSQLLQSEAIEIINNYLHVFKHLVFDAGNCVTAALHYFKFSEQNDCTIALGMGGMGYAIAAAVGIQQYEQQKAKTLVLAGDGAFLMNGLEIHTAVDLKLPILFVIFNNSMHGMCAARQQLYFEGRIICSTYAPVSIAQISRGFGSPENLWVGSSHDSATLHSALKNYLNSAPITGVLELIITAEEIPPFIPLLPVLKK